MTDFILSYAGEIAGFAIALIVCIYAIATRQWSALQRAAYMLMLSAERLMVTEPGKKKMEWVYVTLWQRIPAWIKRFVTEKTLREKLQEWYDLAKDYLNDGAINRSAAP